MINKIYAKGNYLVIEDNKGNHHNLNSTATLDEDPTIYKLKGSGNLDFVLFKDKASSYENEDGTPYNDLTLREFLYANTGFKRALGSKAVSHIVNNEAVTGYSHTGAFAGKPTTNSFVWQPGIGINYTSQDVADGFFKPFSLDRDVHLAVDNPYWRTPDPTKKGIGLFEGEHLPGGVSSLVDYDFDYNENVGGNSNFLLNSENLSTFSSNNSRYTASIVYDQFGPNGTSTVWNIFRTQSGGFSTFNNSQVYVTENTDYFLKFKVKTFTVGFGFTNKTRVRDQSNNALIVAADNYSVTSDGEWTEVSTAFTTPANCTQIQVSLLGGEDITDFLVSEVQVSTSDTSNYLPTANEAINNGVVHQYYALNSNTETGYEDTIGRLKLNDLKVGDQLRVRFEFNAIPQHENTTIEPALWYSNRNDKDEITFSFPLTAQPIFFGTGTAGKTFLNRPELSAWIASEEDINALCLPSIKSDNEIIIQPLGMLITIIR